MTHDTGKFIADVEASLLKKNSRISKHARRLYGTLRALADGRTGELRIGGRWLKATVFDKAAEMCRDVRMAAMRELIAEGLVAMNRPRIWRQIRDRTRAVLGECQYRVFKTPTPKIDQKPNNSSKVDLLKSISSTVDEIDSQYLSEAPLGVRGSVLGLDGKNSIREYSPSSSSSKAPATPNDNDDAGDLIPEVPRPKVNGNPQPNPATKWEQTEAAPVRAAKPRPPKIHPALYGWMRTRILARAAVEPDNPHSYVRAAQEEFLDPHMLPLEIEEYLLLSACDFFEERNRQNPGVTIPLRDCIDVLRAEARKHHLPISDPEIWDRVVRAANDHLGWTITTPVEADAERKKREEAEYAEQLRKKEEAKLKRREKCKYCGESRAWHRSENATHGFNQPRF